MAFDSFSPTHPIVLGSTESDQVSPHLFWERHEENGVPKQTVQALRTPPPTNQRKAQTGAAEAKPEVVVLNT